MFDVAFTSRVEGGAKAASPVLAFAEEFDNLFGVGASLAAVALFMMLVEGIGAPETPIASRFRAGVLSPTLMKFILVALPVIFSFETGLARGAPVYVLPIGIRRAGGNVSAI